MTGAHQQDVPLADRHPLLTLGLLEIIHPNVLTRLEPRLVAKPRNVEQHTAPDESSSQHFD